MSRARLEIAVVRPGWWEWTLVTEDSRTTLGAEDLGNIGWRAVSRLSSGGGRAGAVEGREVFWALSLAEKHHSLYCAVDGTDRLLYFQDRDANIIWKDRLSPEHMKIWIAALGAVPADRAAPGR